MTRNWRCLALAVGLGFFASNRAFAQSGLSEYWDQLKKSQLPGMSDNSASKKPRRQSIWNSKNKKIEVKAGLVKRYWLEQDAHLDLGMLDTAPQISLSFFPQGLGELEIGLAGGGGRKEYFRKETDKNNLVVWNNSIYLVNLPLKVNHIENIKMWDLQLRGWRNIAGSKEESFQIGLGTHFYVLEKHTKIQAQYEDYGSSVLILNPHYQNSESHSITLIPGFSLGARGKTDISSNLGTSKHYLGSLFFSGEYVWAKPASGASIGGQPINKLNNLSLTGGWAYSF